MKKTRGSTQCCALAVLLAAQPLSGVHAETSLVVNRVLWVDATGTPAENCASLRTTLAGLAGATENYRVNLEPGLYDCGTNTVSVPSLVAVVGAGRRATVIVGTPNSPDTGVVEFDHAPGAGLQRVEVVHRGATLDAVVISVKSSTSLVFEQIGAYNFNSGAGSSIALYVEGGPNFEDQSNVRVWSSEIESQFTGIRTSVAGSGIRHRSLQRARRSCRHGRWRQGHLQGELRAFLLFPARRRLPPAAVVGPFGGAVDPGCTWLRSGGF